MRTIPALLAFLLFPCISGYTQSTDAQRLMEMGIYPVEDIDSDIDYIDTSLLSCAVLSLLDVSADFSNIQDLVWLKECVKGKRAVLVGEDHFNKNIHHLRNRILFALNTFDYFPVIILERPFPYTAFVNYYLQLPEGRDADIFFDEVLVQIVNTLEEYELLQHIRRWNSSHPEKPVSVGYYDVEKTKDELSFTLNQILIPYFKKADPGFQLDWEAVLAGNFEKLIRELKSHLEKAVRSNHTGTYPFMTPEFISAVIDNLESSNNALYVDYMLYRQKALLRNLTDSLFLGHYLQNGKVVIHSGSTHLRTKVEPDSLSGLWEGIYLNHVYEPTLGKTYSIKIESIARSLGEAATIGSSYEEPALGYTGLLHKMQEAFNEGIMDPNECYFIDIYNEVLNEYCKFWINKGQEFEGQGLYIKTARWNDILALIDSKDPNKAHSFIENINDNLLFDDVIIVPCSPIILPFVRPQQ